MLQAGLAQLKCEFKFLFKFSANYIWSWGEFWLSCKCKILVALKSRKGVGSVEAVACDTRCPPVKSGSRGSNSTVLLVLTFVFTEAAHCQKPIKHSKEKLRLVKEQKFMLIYLMRNTARGLRAFSMNGFQSKRLFLLQVCITL